MGKPSGISAKPTASAAQVTLVSGATYLPFGSLNTLTFGNGRVVTKAYDANYGIDKVSDAATGGISEDFTLNVVGNVTGLVERTTATANTTRGFTYDGQDRVTALKNGATSPDRLNCFPDPFPACRLGNFALERSRAGASR